MFIFVGSSFPYDGRPSPGSACSGFDDSDVGPSIAGGGAGGGSGTLLYNGSCAGKVHKPVSTLKVLVHRVFIKAVIFSIT